MSPNKRLRLAGTLTTTYPPVGPNGFNDPSVADVFLRLVSPHSSLSLFALSHALRRSRYFHALLSGRWPHHHHPHSNDDVIKIIPSSSDNDDDNTTSITAMGPTTTNDVIKHHLSYRIGSSDDDDDDDGTDDVTSFDAHVDVILLLHTMDFSKIETVSHALELIPVALELLFDECLTACIRYMEAVPWTATEEEEIMNLIPLLGLQESRELLARVCPVSVENCSAEEMLYSLLEAAIKSHHPNGATVKTFVAKLLEDYSCRVSVRRVLDRAFLSTLETLKEFLGKFARPDLRMAADSDEREAMQRLNLHSAMVNAKHLLWIVERMIELRVADTAVSVWSEQAALAADLQKTFREDGWKNFAPGLPLLVIRCTSKLATAVASGTALAPRQVRMMLVRDWLQVLNACKDIVSPLPTGPKAVYQDLEETFLKIISTLPISDAQTLLQQCLGFSTRNIDDCSHLLMAFQTWFRRANRPPFDDKAI